MIGFITAVTQFLGALGGISLAVKAVMIALMVFLPEVLVWLYLKFRIFLIGFFLENVLPAVLGQFPTVQAMEFAGAVGWIGNCLKIKEILLMYITMTVLGWIYSFIKK